MRSFSRYQPGGKIIPEKLLPVMEILERRFGDRLQLVTVDGDWLTFRVIGMVETALILQLQREADTLFGQNVLEYQVATPINERKADGVSVRWVGLARQNEENYSGFWFY